MKNVSNERWVMIIPATPLLLSLVALIILVSAPERSEVWAYTALIMTIVFPLTPCVGAGVLATLFWCWLKDEVTFKHSRVLIGVAMSFLDIVIPLTIVIYIGWNVRLGF